ncbi:MAG TPA: hypothetical protein VG013_15955 [Gemmataceae bacterium]|nr:hypothetical protein [Gemmataceae bacterium]
MIRYAGIRSFLKFTSSGHPFKVWREEPLMPRFDDRILDCSLYLYPTEKDAVAGSRAWGSGFLAVVDGIIAGVPAAVKSPEPDFYFYAVSNRHVAKKSPVVRLNKHDGKFDVIPLTYGDWVSSDEHDIAVAPISYNKAHKYLFVSVIDKFLTKDIAKECDVGIGDEVFMVGRLVNHDGKQRNSPSLRWGHISMMPFEPVYHPTNPNNEQESFLVEVHSVSGYSGSPVFVRPFKTQKLHASFPDDPRDALQMWKGLPAGPWLLGVEWGYINNHDQRYNTGISGVVPAWYVTDLLNTETLKMQRAQEQKERVNKRKEGGTTETSQEDAGGDISKEEFETALKRASRKVPSSPERPSESGQGTP